MKRSSAIIGISVAMMTIALWAFFNKPEHEPSWPRRIQGFSFSPMQAGYDPSRSILPTEAEIDADLALLSGTAHAIRTYTVTGIHGKIPTLAKKHDINVALGAWIDGRLDKNESELEILHEILSHARNVVRVIVGNEVILRNDIPIELVMDYLDRVRQITDLPVSTAEPWHVWLKYPELVEHVDFIAVHMLPYWEGIDVNDAVAYIINRLNEVKDCYPDKPIIIAEVGWPSNGRPRRAAVASPANQATFLRRFLERAEKENYIYYVMEAFDQPWKRINEGAVGAYWGVYDVERKTKFPFKEPIVPIPPWRILAGISVVIAGILLIVLFIDSHTLRKKGRSFLAIVAYALATAAVWIVYDYVHQYLTVTTVIVGILMFCGMVGVILMLLTEAHEWAEALWITKRRRSILPVFDYPTEQLPFVSIHVPTYNEPPEMMIKTLDSLAALDYPRYEVIVIDNNTKDNAIWGPVRDHCVKLGQRFRFYHVDPIGGFKAGALNFALRNTHAKARVIAVIDSDYWVSPNWLKDLTPHFDNPAIALIQAPQDYRDARENLFKSMCYAEYKGFFYIGMITRNERNAIIQHGTMTLVRRNILEDIGGWSEWCITEDAELGLRIFECGMEGVYIPKSYGKGVMPDGFLDYKKQRYRWAYGAIQILKHHRKHLAGSVESKLNHGQRYHFLAGWMPWITDSVNLIFNIGAIGWSIAMILFPVKVDPPLMELSVLPLAYFAFKTAKMLYLYRTQVKATFLQTAAAGLAGLALSHTIAKAVIMGFYTRDLPFFRTPKWAQKHFFIRTMVSVWQEGALMLILWGLAALIYLHQSVPISDILFSRTPQNDAEPFLLVPNPDLHLWIAVLLMQSLPYFCSLIVAFVSGLSRLSGIFLGKMPHALQMTLKIGNFLPWK